MVARFEGYVNAVWRIGNDWNKSEWTMYEHMTEKLRIPQCLYSSYRLVKSNQKEGEEKCKVFTLKERKSCDISARPANLGLPWRPELASWSLRLQEGGSVSIQGLLRANLSPEICIKCGEVWHKQNHHDHSGAIHLEPDHKTDRKSLSKLILLDFWEIEILPISCQKVTLRYSVQSLLKV